MVPVSQNVQTNYVITTEASAAQVKLTADAGGALNVVDKVKFREIFRAQAEKGADLPGYAPDTFWDLLFGHVSWALEHGLNRKAQYLTDTSCEMVLKHHDKFISGIDFEHLPRGFFLAKNPQNNGVRDILHYSDHAAHIQKKIDPLAITFDDVNAVDGQVLAFEDTAQDACYKKLCRKQKPSGWDEEICSQQALNAAFIAFSNRLEALGLRFDALDLDDITSITEDLNPIVLLGRWETVLMNRNLKREDRQVQWQALPKLLLHHSKGAIRALTDYAKDRRPCGIVLPEMGFSAHTFLKTRFVHVLDGQPEDQWGYRSINTIPEITDRRSFWRYIAFQPQRQSVGFYEKALSALDALESKMITKDNLTRLLHMLVGSSTGINALPCGVQEEEGLAIWVEVCGLIGCWETLHPLAQTVAFVVGDDAKARVRNEAAEHFSRFNPAPNFAWLNSISLYIQNFFSRGLVPDVKKLIRISNQANACISSYGEALYQGSRFYFGKPDWQTSGLKAYLEFQEQTSLRYASSHCLLAAHVSTFNLSQENFKDYKRDIVSLHLRPQARDKLSFALQLLHDIQSNKGLDISHLAELMGWVRNAELTYDALLDNLENTYADYFEDGYFSRKRQQLLDAKNGLSMAQMNAIKMYDFSPEQELFVITLQTEVIKHNHVLVRQDVLDHITLTLHDISMLVLPAEFTTFVQRLTGLGASLGEHEMLVQLLETIAEQRTLLGFEQVYLRNKIEHVTDDVVQKFLEYVSFVKPFTDDFYSITVKETSADKMANIVDKVLLQETLATLLLNASPGTYEGETFEALADAIQKLIFEHPQAQYYVMEGFNCIQDRQEEEYIPNVLAYMDTLCRLSRDLLGSEAEHSMESMQIFYSILARYHKSPQALLEIYQCLGTNTLSSENRLFILTFLSRLAAEDRAFDEMLDFVEWIVGLGKEQYAQFERYAVYPPYPSIEQWKAWLDAVEPNVEQNYAAYAACPFGERRLDFAFNLTQYRQQATQFNALIGQERSDLATLFDDELGMQLEAILNENRTKSPKQLRALFVEACETKDKKVLLCSAIEMLARTVTQYDQATKREISQELNSTQVMALYAMLMNPTHKLIAEIYTGEGKSRIMMILAACFAGQGFAVDFMTSDLQLAERDYFAYMPLFLGLDIPISLITLSTPAMMYQRNGVNFSDNAQLLLLRNKSDIDDLPHAYLHEDTTKRCLLLDEIDKFKDDKSTDAFNYAAYSAHLAEFTWVYMHLVQFMKSHKISSMEALDEYQALSGDFLKYIQTHDVDPMHYVQLEALNASHPLQIPIWLQSASKAWAMEPNVNYALTSREETELYRIRDNDGHMRYAPRVLVLHYGRTQLGSMYANGLHQCLVAKENLRLGDEVFIIEAENAIQRTNYPVTFMAQYDAGKTLGVSGTARAKLPMQHPGMNHEGFDYLLVPRERLLRREDKHAWVAKDEAQQFAFIKKSVQFSLEQQHAVLIICKDDHQSQALYDMFQKDVVLKEKLTRVHSLSSKQEEKDAIHHAGHAGQITLSTAGMFSRGVDINAAYLSVIAAYVPTIDDEIQIKGRTGRAGRPGEYRMIPSLDDKDSLLQGGTYSAQHEIDRHQNQLAYQAEFQKSLSCVYAVFLEELTRACLTSRPNTSIKASSWLSAWEACLDELHQDWEEKKAAILSAIEREEKQQFDTLFDAFTGAWKANISARFDGIAFAPASDTQGNATSVYRNLSERRLRLFQPELESLKVQERYDPADDGQARIYNSLFVKEIATLRGERPWFADYHAWREGRGVLFPDLMASLEGNRPLFANLIETIKRWIKALVDYFCPEVGDDGSDPSLTYPGLSGISSNV